MLSKILSVIILSFMLIGCNTSNLKMNSMKFLGCTAGGAGGAYIAKMYAEEEAKRLNLSPQEAQKRKESYVIGLALMGCGIGGALAGTAYEKMSEAGKRKRQEEMLAAASSAQIRTYKDPENPDLFGKAVPQPAYKSSNNKECRNVEDFLADTTEPVVVKYCRSLPSGEWQEQLS